MNRSEHVEWCKVRALEYVNENDITNAWASMISDLGKHRETKNHAGIKLGMMLMTSGKLSSTNEMKKFINGFS